MSLAHARVRARTLLALLAFAPATAARSAEHGFELALERRLGSRLALALSSGFDLAAGPRSPSLALELRCDLDF